MNFGIGTLKKALCTLSIGGALLVGLSIPTQAQRRRHGPPPWAPAYGRRYDRPYGEVVSARRHARNELRRDLRIHQRNERRVLNSRLRYGRGIYGNSPSWRYHRRQEREALRIHQRREKQEFKGRWKNNGRH
jgi:hypothetical protein